MSREHSSEPTRKRSRWDDDGNYYRNTYNWTPTVYKRESNPRETYRSDDDLHRNHHSDRDSNRNHQNSDTRRHESRNTYHEVRREVNVYHETKSYIYQNWDLSRDDYRDRDNPSSSRRDSRYRDRGDSKSRPSNHRRESYRRRESREKSKSPEKSTLKLKSQDVVVIESDGEQRTNENTQNKKEIDHLQNKCRGRNDFNPKLTKNVQNRYFNQNDKSRSMVYPSDLTSSDVQRDVNSGGGKLTRKPDLVFNKSQDFIPIESSQKNILLNANYAQNSTKDQRLPHEKSNQRELTRDVSSKNVDSDAIFIPNINEKMPSSPTTTEEIILSSSSRAESRSSVDNFTMISKENVIFQACGSEIESTLPKRLENDSCEISQENDDTLELGENVDDNENEIVENSTHNVDVTEETTAKKNIKTKKRKKNKKTDLIKVSWDILNKILPERRHQVIQKANHFGNGVKIRFRLGISDGKQFFRWHKEHEDKTGIKYKKRKQKTKLGGQFVFKAIYRCVDFDRKLDGRITPNKCPSKLTVTILSLDWIKQCKKLNKSTMLLYPTEVNIVFNHKHLTKLGLIQENSTKIVKEKATENEILCTNDEGCQIPEIIDVVDEEMSKTDLLMAKIEKIRQTRNSELNIDVKKIGDKDFEITVMFLSTVKKFTINCPVLIHRLNVIEDCATIVLSVEFSISKLPIAVLFSTRNSSSIKEILLGSDITHFLEKVENVLIDCSDQTQDFVDIFPNATVMTSVHEKIKNIWDYLWTKNFENKVACDVIFLISRIFDDVDDKNNVDLVSSMLLTNLFLLIGFIDPISRNLDSFFDFLAENSSEKFDFLSQMEDLSTNFDFVELNEICYHVKDKNSECEFVVDKKFGLCNCEVALKGKNCVHRTAMLVRQFRRMRGDLKPVYIPKPRICDEDLQRAQEIHRRLRMMPFVTNESKMAEVKEKLNLVVENLNSLMDSDVEIVESVDAFCNQYLELPKEEISSFLKK